MDTLWLHLVAWLHRVGLHVDAGTVEGVAQVAGDTSRALGQMDTTALLALAAALGWASGIRLYAVVFLVGVAGALNWLVLPPGLALLQHPMVLLASGGMLVVEFFADKLPWLDSLWDALHAFVRVPAGAALAAGVFGADNATLALVAALLGGSLSATALTTKMSARAAVNTSPEPFSNWGLSFFEDGLVVVMLWLAVEYPLWFAAALAAVLLVSVLLLVVLARFLRVVLRRLNGLLGGAGKQESGQQQ